MTTFEDGPAKGQKLMLRNAPQFLRVVVENGKFDALDQHNDMPRQTEALYAYELTAQPGLVHINGGKGRHGFYPVANYRLVKLQPTDAQMRNRGEWILWCSHQMKY